MRLSLDWYVWKAMGRGEKVDGNEEFYICCRHVLMLYRRIWLLYTWHMLGSGWKIRHGSALISELSH